MYNQSSAVSPFPLVLSKLPSSQLRWQPSALAKPGSGTSPFYGESPYSPCKNHRNPIVFYMSSNLRVSSQDHPPPAQGTSFCWKMWWSSSLLELPWKAFGAAAVRFGNSWTPIFWRLNDSDKYMFKCLFFFFTFPKSDRDWVVSDLQVRNLV